MFVSLLFVMFSVNQVHQVKEQSFVSRKTETVNEQKWLRNYINPQLAFVIRECGVFYTFDKLKKLV